MYGFKKSIKTYSYDLQNVHYDWLLKNAGKEVNKFYFLAVEKEPPFAVGVYFINDKSLIKACNSWDFAIKRFAVCQTSGVYPAYSDEPVELNLSNEIYD
jgi:exodeoxyribonuclease VIII